MFTGTLRLKICEACGLRPTDFQTRHTMTFGRLADQQLIDPYVSIDVDEKFIDRSTMKQRTFDPVWNESFIHEVENASVLGMTIFHEGFNDVFVANATIPFDDLMTRNESEQQDFWVDLEPQGRLHVKIDLRWNQETNSVSSQQQMQQNSTRRLVPKDQPFLNRRRGAMRRRVHQVSKTGKNWNLH
ncbi:protein kinase C-like [Uranotaenia lowii]|uniref:protein kinase C-like n=1 Tax=Uranotaenia lowii TaxID=190385 RepID=UPI002479BA34|nr:protein kinase C-like [Uranotaenia lowii]